MAAGPITLNAVDNLLKEVYEPRVRDQLQSEVTTLRRIEKTSQGVSQDAGGKYVRFVTRMSRNQGIGARRENEVLPNPRSNGYASGQVSLTYQYGALALTGQTLELASTDAQAFANELNAEVDGLKESLVKDMNRQVYGSNAGILATAASGTTTTFVLPDANALYLEVDMAVNIWDTSAGAFGASAGFDPTFVITGISSSGGNTTVTFSPAMSVAVAVGDTMRRAGSSINATTGKELTGFQDIITDSGTLFNIDPSTYPKWKSIVSSNGGTNRNITEGLMLSVVRRMRKQGTRPSVIFTTPGVMAAYWALLSQLREFVNTETFTGGFEGLAFAAAGGKIPLIDDVDCTPNTMYFVSEKNLKLYQMGDWAFQNRTGSNWKQVFGTSNGETGWYDAYISHLQKYCQLATDRRNAHGVIRDITEASDTV